MSPDGVPRFLNVVRGEVSLVAPHPVSSDDVEAYGASRLLYEPFRAALTELVKVSLRRDVAFARRFTSHSYDTRYWSMWLDLAISARTPGAVVGSKWAY